MFQGILCRRILFRAPQLIRLFHEEFRLAENVLGKNTAKTLNATKSVVKEPIVFDLEEEKQKSENNLGNVDSRLRINLERGTTGVFEIEELVELMKQENAEDIFVCTVPKEIKYVDFMCIVTGRNFRHMTALAELVRRAYKIKRQSGDVLPKIEGEKSKDWMAMDLGNIALHIFSERARQTYDLESLWCIGPEFDSLCNQENDVYAELFDEFDILSQVVPKRIPVNFRDSVK